MADVANQQQQAGGGVDVQGAQQQPQQPSTWSVVKSLATRMLILYFAMQAMSYFRQGKPGNIYQKGAKFVSSYLYSQLKHIHLLLQFHAHKIGHECLLVRV